MDSCVLQGRRRTHYKCLVVCTDLQFAFDLFSFVKVWKCHRVSLSIRVGSFCKSLISPNVYNI